jgi:NADH-quinone oxidoreductase subunit E
MAEAGERVSVLSKEAEEEILALPPLFPNIRSAVPPALDIAQDEIGYLPKQAITEVARLLELDPGYVEGVTTFYTLLHTQPIGKHHFYVCTNLSCALRGAYEILEHTMRRMGVDHLEEVSADGLFSVQEVECLGACEFAPMMRYHRRYHYDLTPAKIDDLIDAARRGETSTEGEE